MLIVAHRGNSLAELKAALEHKVDAVEFDVRVTGDNVPVLIHDGYILPENSKGKLIRNTTFKELKTVKPDLATLDEALRFLHKKTKVVIEIKPSENIEVITDCIQSRLRNGWQAADMQVASRDMKLLRVIQDELPSVGLVVIEPWSGIRARLRARKIGTKYITMNHKWLWSGYVKAVARSGYLLSGYTINDVAKAKKLQAAGLHAVITDFPERFSA